MTEVTLEDLKAEWPEGSLYKQAPLDGRGRPRFVRWMYVIPRRALGVTEWTKAASIDKLDDGKSLTVAWFSGDPSKLDLVKP